MQTENLTHSQVKRKCTAAVKNWIKANNFPHVQAYCIRGIFHVNNANNYLMSAKYIMEQATGLEFEHISATMTKLKNQY